MRLVQRYGIIYGLIVACFGCKQAPKSLDYAYLGGQIINPKTTFVKISSPQKPLDTVFLDGYNRFFYKIKKPISGFYTFSHADELQQILLEPGDSVVFRVNTFDFDESLVYSGKGAAKNNYFADEYLENEALQMTFFKNRTTSPEAFQKALDAFRNKKLKHLRAFKKKHPVSTLFNTIATRNIKYAYFFNKEMYPLYAGIKRDDLKTLPKDFYAYRKTANYNDTLLKDHYIYRSFLLATINNLALNTHLKHQKATGFKKETACYAVDKMRFTDSLISSPSIKNGLLFFYTSDYITTSNLEKLPKVINYFLKKSTNNDNNHLVQNYATSLKSLRQGQPLPNIVVTDYQNNNYHIDRLLDRPTMISFWSHSYYNHFRDSHQKIQQLKERYPEVKFININTDHYRLPVCSTTLKRNHFPLKNEYQLKTPEAVKQTWGIYPITRVLIVDRHQQIVDSKSNIFSPNLEQKLLEAINR